MAQRAMSKGLKDKGTVTAYDILFMLFILFILFMLLLDKQATKEKVTWDKSLKRMKSLTRRLPVAG
jgi:hypothetical protein